MTLVSLAMQRPTRASPLPASHFFSAQSVTSSGTFEPSRIGNPVAGSTAASDFSNRHYHQASLLRRSSYARAASRAIALRHSGSDLLLRRIVQPRARRRESTSMLMTPSFSIGASGKLRGVTMGQANCPGSVEGDPRSSILSPTMIGTRLATVAIAFCSVAVLG